tara:strand:+ start:228 stop:773 length:546 start_codon:yes stop_codon:yes gene_type:complete
MENDTLTMEMLLKRIELLESKVAVLEAKDVKQKTNTVNVSTFHTPSIKYLQWIPTLEPSQEHMEFLFTQGYIQGISMLVCSLIEQSTEPPIIMNRSKKNQIYIYVEDKWILMDNNHFGKFIDIQQSKLLKLFKQWKLDNPKYQTEEYSDILSKYLQNILGTKYPKMETIQRIRTTVYSSLL